MKNKRLNTRKLRYVFYILLTCVLCVGCDGKSNYAPKTEDLEYKVIVIDKCEYVIMTYHQFGDYAGYGYMAHKGNCKYCAKRAR